MELESESIRNFSKNVIVNEVELRGTIRSIEPKNQKDWTSKNMTTNFTVVTDKSRRTIKVRCPFFCPIQEGDTIAAFGTSESSNFITLKQPPLVLIGTEDSVIRNCFLQALNRSIRSPKDRTNRVDELMKHLTKVVRSANLLDKTGELIDQYMRELAEDYNHSKDSSLLESFDSVLNAKQCKTLLRWWFKRRCLRRLYLLGLTLTEIRESELRPSVLYNQALENPYTVPTIDPSKCDQILKIQGRRATKDQINAGLILRWVYTSCKDNHWGYLPLELLQKKFQEELSPSLLLLLEKDYGVIVVNDQVHLKELHLMNDELFKIWLSTGVNRSQEEVSKLVEKLPEHLSSDQKSAIEAILSNRWSILTGPAGSGKTCCIQTLVDLLVNDGKNVLVVAFTGKAVARILEVLGAGTFACVSTIHRFLASFNDETPTYHHVFIDEASMVEQLLFNKFLVRLHRPFNLTLIGDPHQLPPIHWSSPFVSLINSEVIPHAKLEKIHRTKELSNNGLYVNGQKIRNWQPEEPLEIQKSENFQMIQGDISTIEQIVKVLVMGKVPLESMVIICPYNKYLGELNEILRRHLPDQNFVVDKIDGQNWKVGDRVMLTKNNYDIGIMNGEEGIVTSIGPEEIVVKFEKYVGNAGTVGTGGSQGTQNPNEWNQVPHEKSFGFSLKDPTDEDVSLDYEAFSGDLTVKYLAHSFAITIHKSQGSEKEVVIFFVPSEISAGTFFGRRLVYTAITRASKGIFIIGNINAFLTAVVTEEPKIYDALEEKFKLIKKNMESERKVEDPGN